MAKFKQHSSALEGPFRHAERLENGDLVLRFRTAGGQFGSIVRLADGKPARNVRPGWQERPTILLSSAKAHGAREAESRLEAEACWMFDLDPAVVSYETQPFTVKYEIDGDTISTYPDIELKLTSGIFEIVQIKMQSTYEKHLRENPRFRCEREIFERLGWSYKVMTEIEIRAEPKLSNLKLLRHYRKRPVSHEIMRGVIAAVGRKPGATIREVVDTFQAGALHEVDVVALIAQHKICADLSLPIRSDTRLIAPL